MASDTSTRSPTEVDLSKQRKDIKNETLRSLTSDQPQHELLRGGVPDHDHRAHDNRGTEKIQGHVEAATCDADTCCDAGRDTDVTAGRRVTDDTARIHHTPVTNTTNISPGGFDYRQYGISEEEIRAARSRRRRHK